jgi:hypothetical protein
LLQTKKAMIMKKRLLIYVTLICLAVNGFSQSTINDPFFDQVAYRGAFNATDDWTAGWANWDCQNTVYPAATVTVSGELTSNATWTSNNVYLIQGFYYVRGGVTLTIQPGTIIRGDKDTKGSLIIERGAKLMAEGTVSQPIVFTSNFTPGNRAYGDWGGVILCGKATINPVGGTAIIEGGPTSEYGGSDDNDNSGSLKFVRIEFPGIPFVPDKEINGLTFGGVGKSTQIDYVQVSYSGDDSYEWFGGTVNCKHLIAYRGWDDDFDTDFGFRGLLQFCVSLRDKDIADPGSGSNGFESDNDASGSTNTPQTKCIMANMSVFGPKYDLATAINSNFKRAMHLRRNSSLSTFNSVFTGWPTGLFIDGTASQGNATNGDMKIQRCVMSGMGQFFASSFEHDFFMTPAFGNDTLATNDLLMYVDPFNLGQPNFLLQSGSELRSGSIWPQTGLKENNKAFAASVYPNPVSEKATIRFNLESTKNVSVSLYDITGLKIADIANTTYSPGENEINYDASALAKGMYFVQITDGVKINSLKMIVR